MTNVLVIKGEVEEGVDPMLYRLVVDAFGTPLVPADVTANGIQRRIYDRATDATISTASSLDPNTLMFVTLQTTGWTQTGDGYNFRDRISVTGLGLTGGKTYRIEYKLSLAASQGSGVAFILFDLAVVSVSSL